MKKEHILTITLFVLLILSVVLDKLGLALISKIVGGLLTIGGLIVGLPNIKAMNKKLFAIVMSITIVPALLLVYAMFSINIYLMWGSLICLILSFPIGITIIQFNRKREQSKPD